MAHAILRDAQLREGLMSFLLSAVGDTSQCARCGVSVLEALLPLKNFASPARPGGLGCNASEKICWAAGNLPDGPHD